MNTITFSLSFLGTFAQLRNATISFVMSVLLSAWNNSVPTGWIFMKSDVSVFFQNLLKKFNFLQNRSRKMVTWPEDQYTFSSIARSVLRMRNVSDKDWREHRSTHVMFHNVYRISYHLWDNLEKFCRAGVAIEEIWLIRSACWMPKATNTHSQYVIFIALPRQQLLKDRGKMLCLCTHCLSCCIVL